MCCFAGKVTSVSQTNIYATTISVAANRQFLAYQMDFVSQGEMALILPIPVRSGTQEVDFCEVDTKFFQTLDNFFPSEYTSRSSTDRGTLKSLGTLEVKRIGSYEVSFVPTVSDFDRVDPRFRLPRPIWANLEQEKYGFVVAKLAEGRVYRGTLEPLAFAFYRDDKLTNGVFFPTFHIHDGEVHREEVFDHSLYFQAPRDFNPHVNFSRTFKTGSAITMTARTEGANLAIVEAGPIYKTKIHGKQFNADTFLQFS